MTHTFDPNGVALHGKLFGLPYTVQESELVIVPIPLDMTTSSGKGTHHGPQVVLDASAQVDLYDLTYKNFREKGIHMLDIPERIVDAAVEKKSQAVIDALSNGNEPLQEDIAAVNQASEQVNQYVYTQTKQLLDQ